MPSENFAGWLLVGVSLLFLIWMALRAETRRARNSLETREERMLREIGELENTVQTLLKKLNESQREIEELQTQLKKTTARITELEVMYEIAPGQPVTRLSPKRKLLKPLLVVCGQDAELVGTDLQVLDAIGIRYTRLINATLTDVSDAISTAREDNRLYRWLLISAHAGTEGVELATLAPPDFWMRLLGGIEVVGLAACRTTNLADHLRDKVRFVWYFREGVPNEHANRFVQKFFQRLNAGEDPETAFIASLDAVPEVAAYADYRAR